jgi:hypothetical protein
MRQDAFYSRDTRRQFIVGWIEQLRQQRAHFPIVEPTQLETEYDPNREQCLHSLVAEAQGRCPLSLYLSGTNHPGELFANRAIVRIFWTSRRRRLA